MICKYFLPFGKLCFHCVDGFLCCAKAFLFDVTPLVYFCFCCICFFYLYFHFSRRWIQKYIAPIYVNECTAFMFSSKSFIVSCLTLRSLIIDFEFIFVYIILFIYCGWAGSLFLCGLFSSCSKQGLLSS